MRPHKYAARRDTTYALFEHAAFATIAVIGGKRTLHGRPQYLITWATTVLPREFVDRYIRHGPLGPNVYRERGEGNRLRCFGSPDGSDSQPNARFSVEWKPQWLEFTPLMQARHGATLAAWEAGTRVAPAQAQRPAGPSGCPPRPHPTPLATVTIQRHPGDPAQDVVPDPQGRATATTRDGMVLFHAPSGGYCGTLPAERARALWTRYARANPLRSPADFNQRMSQLLGTTRDGRPTTLPGHASRSRHEWALPAGIVTALCRVFSVDCEYFSSPLTVHSDVSTFYTARACDSSFQGARLDAFSNTWRGAGLATPEFEDPQLLKAVRWALGSARLGPACLTVLVIPVRPIKAYYKLLSAAGGLGQRVCAVPAKTIQPQRDGWPPPTRGSPAPLMERLEFWVVANAAGISQYYQAAELVTLGQALPPTAVLTALGPSPQDARLPTRHRYANQHLAEVKLGPDRATAQRTESPPHAAASSSPTPVWLRFATRRLAFGQDCDIVYTDGSLQTEYPLAGCGVHAPSGFLPDAAFRFTGAQSVLRAELAAILWVLAAAAVQPSQGRHLVVATDSLTSQQLISKALYEPHELLHSRQAPILAKIVELLRARDACRLRTTFQKVLAHSGVDGNERADELAKAAAAGKAPYVTGTPDFELPEEGRCGFRWYQLQRTEPKELQLLEDSQAIYRAAQASRVQKMVNEFPKSLAARSAVAAPVVGLLGQESQLYWGAKRAGLSRADKRQVQRVRAAGFMGNAKRKQLGFTQSTRCDHCGGGYDDGYHVLSGCTHPALRGQQTYRHDESTNAVAANVGAAERGSPFHLYVSAGARFKCASPNVTHGAPTLPAWLWDPHRAGYGACTEVPDLVYVDGWSSVGSALPPTPRDLTIKIVVADMAHGPWMDGRGRIRRKQDRYAHIVPHLRAQGWRVVGFSYGASLPDPNFGDAAVARVHERMGRGMGARASAPCVYTRGPQQYRWVQGYDYVGVLSLGTTGEVYWSTRAVLGCLGLAGPAVEGVLRSLHFIVISYVRPLFATRRHLDSSGKLGSSPLGTVPPGGAHISHSRLSEAVPHKPRQASATAMDVRLTGLSLAGGRRVGQVRRGVG